MLAFILKSILGDWCFSVLCSLVVMMLIFARIRHKTLHFRNDKQP